MGVKRKFTAALHPHVSAPGRKRGQWARKLNGPSWLSAVSDQLIGRATGAKPARGASRARVKARAVHAVTADEIRQRAGRTGPAVVARAGSRRHAGFDLPPRPEAAPKVPAKKAPEGSFRGAKPGEREAAPRVREPGRAPFSEEAWRERDRGAAPDVPNVAVRVRRAGSRHEVITQLDQEPGMTAPRLAELAGELGISMPAHVKTREARQAHIADALARGEGKAKPATPSPSAPARASEGGGAEKPSPRLVVSKLESSASREEANAHLEGLTLGELGDVAMASGTSTAGASTPEVLRKRIVEHTVGFRLAPATVREASGPTKAGRKAAPAKAAVDPAQVADQLGAASSREEAHKVLSGLDAKTLRAVAEASGARGGLTTKEAMRERIVEHTVGSRLDHAAVRGRGESQPGLGYPDLVGHELTGARLGWLKPGDVIHDGHESATVTAVGKDRIHTDKGMFGPAAAVTVVSQAAPAGSTLPAVGRAGRAVPALGKAAGAKKAKLPPGEMTTRLMTLPSREEAHQQLEGYAKTDLVALAKELSVPSVSRRNMSDLRLEIVEATTGRRLDSVAIRGFEGDRPGLDATGRDTVADIRSPDEQAARRARLAGLVEHAPDAAPAVAGGRAAARDRYQAVADAKPYAAAAAELAELRAKKTDPTVIADHIRAIGSPHHPATEESGAKTKTKADLDAVAGMFDHGDSAAGTRALAKLVRAHKLSPVGGAAGSKQPYDPEAHRHVGTAPEAGTQVHVLRPGIVLAHGDGSSTRLSEASVTGVPARKVAAKKAAAPAPTRGDELGAGTSPVPVIRTTSPAGDFGKLGKGEQARARRLRDRAAAAGLVKANVDGHDTAMSASQIAQHMDEWEAAIRDAERGTAPKPAQQPLIDASAGRQPPVIRTSSPALRWDKASRGEQSKARGLRDRAIKAGLDKAIVDGHDTDLTVSQIIQHMDEWESAIVAAERAGPGGGTPSVPATAAVAAPTAAVRLSRHAVPDLFQLSGVPANRMAYDAETRLSTAEMRLRNGDSPAGVAAWLRQAAEELEGSASFHAAGEVQRSPVQMSNSEARARVSRGYRALRAAAKAIDAMAGGARPKA